MGNKKPPLGGSKLAVVTDTTPPPPETGHTDQAALKRQLESIRAEQKALGSGRPDSPALAALNLEEAAVRSQIVDSRKPTEQLLGLQGVVQRGERRLTSLRAEKGRAEQSLKDVEARLQAEQDEVERHKAELQALENKLATESPLLRAAEQDVPPWLRDYITDFLKHLKGGTLCTPEQVAATFEGILSGQLMPTPMPATPASTATTAGTTTPLFPPDPVPIGMDEDNQQDEEETPYQTFPPNRGVDQVASYGPAAAGTRM